MSGETVALWMFILFVMVSTAVALHKILIPKTTSPHTHDFYEFGNNFTMTDAKQNIHILLYCGCGEVRTVVIGKTDMQPKGTVQ